MNINSTMGKKNLDDELYEQVASELQNKTLSPGLWTKAYAEANGDEAKARALYIKFRVKQLRDAVQAQVNREEVERRESEKAAQPKLSGPVKFANFLLAAFCGLITFAIILVMIGFFLDQSDTSETAEDKIVVLLILCVPAFGFGWVTYKCVKALQR